MGRTRDRQQEFVNHRKNCPCADCGKTFPPHIMQFDHRPGEKKSGNVSDMMGRVSDKRLRDEMDKCDIVCANDHADRTWRRSRAALCMGDWCSGSTRASKPLGWGSIP